MQPVNVIHNMDLVGFWVSVFKLAGVKIVTFWCQAPHYLANSYVLLTVNQNAGNFRMFKDLEKTSYS